jgi:ubiquinone/menaquinone biosynthesis C-methylase UbiE
MNEANKREYFLGHSDPELRRLERQNEFYRDATEHFLRRAGLVPGMRVLDIGCGGGDVSLLAAEIVGPSGAVVGIDRTAQGIAAARRRIEALGVKQIEFAVSELEAFTTDVPFDAVIGRFVLMYLSDPSATLRALMRHLRPGGIVAFQEMEMRTARSQPQAPLFERCAELHAKAIELGGFETAMGGKLFATLHQAGLPAPQVIVGSRAEGGADSPGYELMAENVRSALPMLERHKVTSATEIGTDTLVDRLRQETVASGGCVMFPLLMGAWSRVPA